MKLVQCIILIAGLGSGFLPARAAVVLSSEHMDFRPVYDALAGKLTNILVNDFDSGQSFESNQVAILVKESAKLTLPGDFPPLGSSGDPLWVLPMTQDPNLVYLGVSGEHPTLAGVFPGTISLTLTAVRGRGNFFAWQVNQFSEFSYKMAATNGVVTSTNTIAAFVGSHAHFNWGFTTSGVYQTTFQVSGQRNGETTNVFSPYGTFTFFVEPLPPFESWQTNHWPVYGPQDVVGPAADPDGDGLANLLEYAYATNPAEAGVTNLPVYSITNIAGTNYGALTFTRNKSASDVTLTPEVASFPGGPWSAMTNLLGTVDLGATERLTYRDATPLSVATNRYAHLKVTLP